MRALLASNVFRAGVVVVSAAIIFGAWAFAEYGGEDPGPSGPGITLSLEDDLYEQARQAAESGETTRAVTLLERVLAEDPGHERAASLLRRLKGQVAAADPAGPARPGDTAEDPGGSPPGDTTPRDDSAYLVAAGDLRSLVPDAITGWRRGTPVVSDTDVAVPFEPVAPGTVSRALYSVHDRGSAEAATAFVDTTSMVVYESDGAQVRVGAVDGYFGTDGNRLATVAFARGRYAFEVVVTVPGGTPVSVKEAAIALAREFEATR